MYRSIRYLWLGALVGTLASGQNPAGAQSGAPEGVGPTPTAKERHLTVELEGGKQERCKVQHAWKLENGSRCFQVVSVGSGERLTLIQQPASPDGQPGEVLVYAWGKSLVPPKGVPVPPDSLNAPLTKTIQASSTVAGLGAGASRIPAVPSSPRDLATDPLTQALEPVGAKGEAEATGGKGGSKGVGAGMGAQGAGVGAQGAGNGGNKGAGAGAGVQGAGNGGNKGAGAGAGAQGAGNGGNKGAGAGAGAQGAGNGGNKGAGAGAGAQGAGNGGNKGAGAGVGAQGAGAGGGDGNNKGCAHGTKGDCGDCAKERRGLLNRGGTPGAQAPVDPSRGGGNGWNGKGGEGNGNKGASAGDGTKGAGAGNNKGGLGFGRQAPTMADAAQINAKAQVASAATPANPVNWRESWGVQTTGTNAAATQKPAAKPGASTIDQALANMKPAQGSEPAPELVQTGLMGNKGGADGTKGTGAGDGTKGAGAGGNKGGGDGTKGAGAGVGTQGAGAGGNKGGGDGTKGAGAGVGTQGAGAGGNKGGGDGTKGAGAGEALKGIGSRLRAGSTTSTDDMAKLPRAEKTASDPLAKVGENTKLDPAEVDAKKLSRKQERRTWAMAMRLGMNNNNHQDDDSADGSTEGDGSRRGRRFGRLLGAGPLLAAGVDPNEVPENLIPENPMPSGTPSAPPVVNLSAPVFNGPAVQPIQARPWRPDGGVPRGMANAFTNASDTRPVPADFGKNHIGHNAFANPPQGGENMPAPYVMPDGVHPALMDALKKNPQLAQQMATNPDLANMIIAQANSKAGMGNMMLAPGQMPPGQMPPGMLPPGMMPPGMMPSGMAAPGMMPGAPVVNNPGALQLAPGGVMGTPVSRAPGHQVEVPLNLLRDSLLPSEREAALDMLAKPQLSSSNQVVGAVVKCLASDPAPAVRAAAARTLGQMGCKAPEAIQTLQASRTDGDANVRLEVDNTLLLLSNRK